MALQVSQQCSLMLTENVTGNWYQFSKVSCFVKDRLRDRTINSNGVHHVVRSKRVGRWAYDEKSFGAPLNACIPIQSTSSAPSFRKRIACRKAEASFRLWNVSVSTHARKTTSIPHYIRFLIVRSFPKSEDSGSNSVNKYHHLMLWPFRRWRKWDIPS